jgi:hypothetical protein
MLQKYVLSSPQNIRRFHALIATPLFMMSAISNFYFFAGMSIGNQFVRRLFEGGSLVMGPVNMDINLKAGSPVAC